MSPVQVLVIPLRDVDDEDIMVHFEAVAGFIEEARGRPPRVAAPEPPPLQPLTGSVTRVSQGGADLDLGTTSYMGPTRISGVVGTTRLSRRSSNGRLSSGSDAPSAAAAAAPPPQGGVLVHCRWGSPGQEPMQVDIQRNHHVTCGEGGELHRFVLIAGEGRRTHEMMHIPASAWGGGGGAHITFRFSPALGVTFHSLMVHTLV